MHPTKEKFSYISQRAARSYLKSPGSQTVSLVKEYALVHEALPKLK